MTPVIESPLRPHVIELLAPIFEAIESNPRLRVAERVDRQFFKLYEELGEVSEAFLAVTGSNTKGLSFDDLDTEQIDSFIVYVDIQLTLASLLFSGDAVEHLKAAIINHLCACLEMPVEAPMGTLLKVTMSRVSDCHLSLESTDKETLQSVYSSLVQTTNETLFRLVLKDARPSHIAPSEAERLVRLAELAKVKTTKWKTNRTSND